MHCLPVVDVSRPDTVQLSGNTTMKAMKAIYNWTVSGFDICPEDTKNIRSPVFAHPNLSKWCLELEKDEGSPMLCFRLVDSNDSLPVSATLKAFVLDRNGVRHYVFPPDVHHLKIQETSSLQSVIDKIDTKELGEDWNFECEVSTVEVVAEDTSDASEEELQSAMAKDLGRLLDSKDLADIKLSAGGVHLEAHRAILCARSPVFRAMLSHDTKEAREGLVEIPDVEPEVVSELLHYMYTDIVQVPSDMTEELLVASDKYGLQDAKLKYELELVRQLTVDTAATIAVYAVVHSCSFLQDVCMAFITQNLQQVVGTKGWANIIDKHPKAVKMISELVTKGSERCTSPAATPGSQSDPTIVNSTAAEPMSGYLTPTTNGGCLDTVCDSGYTRCIRKKVIYVWTVSGLTNWPEDRYYVASPHFFHPETLEWEVKLYKCGTEYDVRFQLLENKAGGSVAVDLSVSVIPPVGEKCRIHTSTGCMFEEESESEKIECGYLVDDTLALECEISMVCVVQQCVVAVKPVLQSGLIQDLHSLLESGNFADFKLCAGTIEMGVHRAILVARSPFFARMLQPGSELLKSGQLEVSNMKPTVLAEVLRYMYTGRVTNLCDSTGELLAAAHRFELCDLKRKCLTYLSRQLALGNAVTTAVCAMDSNCDALLNLCIGFIRSHFKQVMGTAEWIEAIDTHPTALKRISQLIAEPGK
ncbi:uncharacterized protein LOC124551022 [Schistocerca americana]|uniref:uncharacterized protein LOC124551022 n=1 Tax=Schistocerca americana TaxID=7009 RepID=UPI001F4F7DB9|nr:uncharacterized protein LOC124551022 [Schistocerca americana]XP_046981827.1 uncharacterized protein LOC124551022 [Schistocerca americana]XP_046981828.1 uncharacterized protein LOC124551022 [Schistocerca americana]